MLQISALLAALVATVLLFQSSFNSNRNVNAGIVGFFKAPKTNRAYFWGTVAALVAAALGFAS